MFVLNIDFFNFTTEMLFLFIVGRYDAVECHHKKLDQITKLLIRKIMQIVDNTDRMTLTNLPLITQNICRR